MSEMRKLMKLMESTGFDSPIEDSTKLSDVLEGLKTWKTAMEGQGYQEDDIAKAIAGHISQFAQALYDEVMSGQEFDSRTAAGNAPAPTTIQ